MYEQKVLPRMHANSDAARHGLYLPLVFGLYNRGTRCLAVSLFLIVVGVVVLAAAITAMVWVCCYRKRQKYMKINSTFRHPQTASSRATTIPAWHVQRGTTQYAYGTGARKASAVCT